MVRPLIAVDWGTSSLRGARLDDAGWVLEEKSAPLGILNVPNGDFGRVFAELCKIENGTVVQRQVTTDKGESVSRPLCEASAGGTVAEQQHSWRTVPWNVGNAALQTGELCPCNWKAGEPTLQVA
mgnify:CR=1 FL=1